jgi:hypothetical protein
MQVQRETFLHRFTLEDDNDILSRNVGKNLPFYVT